MNTFISMMMAHLMLRFIFCLACLNWVSSENLNGIFTVELCQCSAPTEKCEPSGPFILNHKKSSISLNFGPSQVGDGTYVNRRFDLTLNQHHCNGSWNEETHSLQLKCDHSKKVSCLTTLRCLSGSCLENGTTAFINTASARTTTIDYYFGLLILTLVFFIE